MSFEEHPSIKAMEMMREGYLAPSKESPERPFFLALDGYTEEMLAYLHDPDNKDADETLPESRQNFLEAHRVLAYATMEDKTINDKVKSRLLAGWQADALSYMNGKISMHPAIIKHVEGPWDEKAIDVNGEMELIDSQESLAKQILLTIHGAQLHPNRKSDGDDTLAAERIHESFSTDASYILFRVMHVFKPEEEAIDKPDANLIEMDIPDIDPDFLEDQPIDETKRRGALRFLLGKKASAFLGLEDDNPQPEDWGLDTEIDVQD